MSSFLESGTQSTQATLTRKRGQIMTFAPAARVPLSWSGDTITAKHFLSDYQLPQVVKISGGPGTVAESSLDTGQPLLLYSARKGSKVLANSLRWNESEQTNSNVGPALAIPVNYPGWFQIIKDDLEDNDPDSTCFDSVSKIAATMPKKFLVRSPVMAFQPIKGHDICVARQIGAGEVLTVKRIHTEDGLNDVKQKPADPGRFKVFDCTCLSRIRRRRRPQSQSAEHELNKQYLVCVDTLGKDVIFPFDHKGLFSPVAEDGVEDKNAVYQLSHCIRHLELPINLKLAYGEPPTTTCSFTGTMCLQKLYGDETIIASTLLMDRNVLIEISVDANVHFLRAENTDEYMTDRMYKEALRQCDENVDSYASSIKPWVKVSNSPVTVRTDTMKHSAKSLNEGKKPLYRSIKKTLPPLPDDEQNNEVRTVGDTERDRVPEEGVVHAKLVYTTNTHEDKSKGMRKESRSESEGDSLDPFYDTIPSKNMAEDPHGYLVPRDARGSDVTRKPVPCPRSRASRPSERQTYADTVGRPRFDKVTDWVDSQRFSGDSAATTITDCSHRPYGDVSQQIDDLFRFSEHSEDDNDTIQNSHRSGNKAHNRHDCPSVASMPTSPPPAPPIYLKSKGCADCEDQRLRHLLSQRSMDDPSFMVGSVRVKQRMNPSRKRLTSLNATVRSHNTHRMRKSLGNIPWSTVEGTGHRNDVISGDHSRERRRPFGTTRHASFIHDIPLDAYYDPYYEQYRVQKQLSWSQPGYHDDHSDHFHGDDAYHVSDQGSFLNVERRQRPRRSAEERRRHSFDASQFKSSLSLPNQDIALSVTGSSPYVEGLISPNGDSDFSSYDCEDWIPPEDVATLSINDVKRALRYIGMREMIVRKFYHEQIDGKMLHEMNDKLLQEGFPEMNGLERKKILNFVAGWRPKKD